MERWGLHVDIEGGGSRCGKGDWGQCLGGWVGSQVKNKFEYVHVWSHGDPSVADRHD